MDSECVEEGAGRHGRYASDSKRYQLVLERRLYDAVKDRAVVEGVRDADVVRTALAVYLGWPADYVHPR